MELMVHDSDPNAAMDVNSGGQKISIDPPPLAYLPRTPRDVYCAKFGTAGLLADLITRGNFWQSVYGV